MMAASLGAHLGFSTWANFAVAAFLLLFEPLRSRLRVLGHRVQPGWLPDTAGLERKGV